MTDEATTTEEITEAKCECEQCENLDGPGCGVHPEGEPTECCGNCEGCNCGGEKPAPKMTELLVKSNDSSGVHPDVRVTIAPDWIFFSAGKYSARAFPVDVPEHAPAMSCIVAAVMHNEPEAPFDPAGENEIPNGASVFANTFMMHHGVDGKDIPIHVIQHVVSMIWGHQVHHANKPVVEILSGGDAGQTETVEQQEPETSSNSAPAGGDS